ncbi:hypothetical protein [Yoonia sp. I 8.24]|uniref:hypothetical protein n=1 Tax=Yoonia sp. I 8.24 TaxID=1537229 RepID=UPI001EE10374|nr:hypothetical protein [Yoonia sp. I 8.24]MCG3268898.1 hypothetical protein [Yoonia sp. I 8.24]
MNFPRTLCLVLTLTCGHAAFATPESDARFIAQRQLGPEGLDSFRGRLNESFADVYFEPLAGLGIELIDQDRFAALVPDEDVAPFVDRFLGYTAESYLSVYSPAQLEAIATLLRADDDMTVEDVFSQNYLKQHIAALELARASIPLSGSDDPQVKVGEEFAVQLSAATMLLEVAVEDLVQQVALGAGFIGIFIGYANEIDQLEREIDNPVTIGALKADAILEFANPVQRQDLLRQLTRSESTGGIQFIPAPTRSED